MATTTSRKVMVVGAGGQIGKHIVAALLADPHFSVTALTRPDSTSALPIGLHAVHRANYDDHEALVAAMRGQDILVITMGVMAPPETQRHLVDAAAAAGVRYIVPSEWSCDHAQVQLGRDIMTGDAQAALRAHVTATGVVKWISIGCGFWYEYSLAGGEARFGFDLERKRLTLFDKGETRISVSTWPLTARALARVLAAPDLEVWANRQVLVSSFCVSQGEMLDSVLRVTGGSVGEWTVADEDAHARFARGMGLLQQGDFANGFTTAMYSRAFWGEDPMMHESKTANLALGLEKEELDVATAEALRMASAGEVQV